MLLQLDYLRYKPKLRLSRQKEGLFVFDPIRRKDLAFTPEELLRQLVLQYLLDAKNYPANRIRLELCHSMNGMLRRCDILVFDRTLRPWLIVECKSPKVKLQNATFEQVSHYNLHWQAPFVAITNGVGTFCCAIDREKSEFRFLDDFPAFDQAV